MSSPPQRHPLLGDAGVALLDVRPADGAGPDGPGRLGPDVVKLLPIREIPQKALGKEIPCWREWMDHESMDDYWERSNWERFADKINVPTLYVSGWFDDVGTGTSQAWSMNRRMGRPDQRMILGAWRHQFNVSRDIHGIDYGRARGALRPLLPVYPLVRPLPQGGGERRAAGPEGGILRHRQQPLGAVVRLAAEGVRPRPLLPLGGRLRQHPAWGTASCGTRRPRRRSPPITTSSTRTTRPPTSST